MEVDLFLVLGLSEANVAANTMSEEPDSTNPHVEAFYYVHMDQASSLHDLGKLLEQAFRFRLELTEETAFEIARRICRVASDFSEVNTEDISQFIAQHVLRWCFLTEDESHNKKNLDFELHLFRKSLENWLYGYRPEQMRGIREQILAEVIESTSQTPSKEKIWVISSIGYKSTQATKLLTKLTFGDSPISDYAACALISLGPDPDMETRILDRARAQLGEGRATNFVRLAVQEIVRPACMDVAISYLQAAAVRSSDEATMGFTFTASIATRAVDRCPSGHQAHDEIWSMLRVHPRIVEMSSDISCRCDTRRVIVDIADWAMSLINTEDRSGISSYRMLDLITGLVKPEQIMGWEQIRNGPFLSALETLATRDTESTGKFMTTPARLKEVSLRIAAGLGISETENLLDDILLGESSSAIALNCARTISCFRFSELSDAVCKHLQQDRLELDDEQEHSHTSPSNGNC